MEEVFDLRNTKAYGLFRSELPAQIAKITAGLYGTGAPTHELLAEVHKLKGGAGLFKFEELNKTAGNLERWLLSNQESLVRSTQEAAHFIGALTRVLEKEES